MKSKPSTRIAEIRARLISEQVENITTDTLEFSLVAIAVQAIIEYLANESIQTWDPDYERKVSIPAPV